MIRDIEKGKKSAMMINIHGVNIALDMLGTGPVVLLLHGWGAMRQTWGQVPQALQKMGFCVMSLDFPGHGESDEPPESWTVDDYAKCVNALLEKLDVSSCFVIAHSFGGRVTIQLSNMSPELFQKIVLVDAAGVMPKRTWKYHMRVYRYKLAKKIAKIGWINRLFLLDEKMKMVGSADYRALKTDVMRQTFVKVVNQDLQPSLQNIQAPTLLVWGSEDQDTPLYMAEIMEKEIQNAGLVVFQGAGHYSYLDEFARFMLVIESFFLEGI